MSAAKVVNVENQEVGEITLDPNVFDVEIKEYLLHDMVRFQLAGRRAGNACTKTRIEVKGGGKKPWKQKGTGRARSGSRTSPLWRGGGVVFGPKPRDYSFKLNKKVRRQALAVALSAKKVADNLMVLNDFPMEDLKTKSFLRVMKNLNVDNGLIVISEQNENLHKSARNVKDFKVLSVGGLNVYDILLHEKLVLLKPAVSGIEQRVLS
ncbi:MAG TPA: 50S ribosomal protein L4 [Desulfobulbaceae bacterium]|nr:50S ribosomal protein L4 [Desulfobulbaceae bacterium]